MCLAKAYVRSLAAESDARLLMENVTRVEVDGERVHLTSLLGETAELQARISSVSFTDSRVVLEAAR